ncbi:MAG: bifunctional heptose 7-phosphate kinase/heptose 1-phosphate adenyltransferase [Hyphomicrobiales bacterium]
MKKEDIYQLFDNFKNQKIMIIGDVMVDSYLWGNVDRISPEAPVPVVSVDRRANRLGGSANVALNIKALDADPIMCAVIGNDIKGNEFMDIVAEQGMQCTGIVKSNHRPTTTKFRVIGNNTQLLRVDEEIVDDLNQEEERELLDRIQSIINTQDIKAIIFQDYNKGVLTENIITEVIKMANNNNIPTVVDPKKKNFKLFQNVTLFKPNLKEIKEGMDINFDVTQTDQLEGAVSQLQEALNADIVLNTLSEYGVYIRGKVDNRYESHSIPAHIRNIADVSGAGDTVVSVATLCLATKTSHRDLAAFSNLAGGLVCEEVGVVPISKEKLIQEIIDKELK